MRSVHGSWHGVCVFTMEHIVDMTRNEYMEVGNTCLIMKERLSQEPQLVCIKGKRISLAPINPFLLILCPHRESWI